MSSIVHLKQLPPAVASLLKGYPSLTQLPVQWGDQDASGYISAVTLWRQVETARLNYFNESIAPRLSPSVHTGFIQGKGVGRIMKSATLDIGVRLRVRYPDTLVTGAKTVWIGQDRFMQGYRMVSLQSHQVIAESEAVIVTFDHLTGKKAPVPDEVVQAILAIDTNTILQPSMPNSARVKQ